MTVVNQPMLKFETGAVTVEQMAQEVLRRLRERPNGAAPKPEPGLRPKEVKVPIGVSVRHVHLCPEHVEALFGKGHSLQVYHELYQKGYYAAREQVMVVGHKRCLEKVRVLGPPRRASQVELAHSEAVAIGLKLPVATTGTEPQTHAVTLVGPEGIITLPGGQGGGAFLARRHIHLSDKTAAEWGVQAGDTLRLRIDGPRAVEFDDILVRVKAGWLAEVHLDTDEGNACLVRTGQLGTIILP